MSSWSESVPCDICGQKAGEISDPPSEASPRIRIDQDSLYICHDSHERMASSPVGDPADSDLPRELAALVGKSAGGGIALTLGLPHEPPYEAIIVDARLIAYERDLYMSV